MAAARRTLGSVEQCRSTSIPDPHSRSSGSPSPRRGRAGPCRSSSGARCSSRQRPRQRRRRLPRGRRPGDERAARRGRARRRAPDGRRGASSPPPSARPADRRVVLVGGDGTVHALANLDLPALPPAALLPAGRANNIARALGIPVDWRAAAELAVRGRAAAVDVLEVVTPERRLFAVEGVSAGFHAAARHRYTGENSADLAAGAGRSSPSWPPSGRIASRFAPTAHRCSTARPRRSSSRTCPLFGFGFEVDPMADPADGRLEAIVLDARDAARRRATAAAARQGTHLERDGVRWSRATRAHLESPLPLVADAQPLGVTTATVTVAPGRLRLVAPEAAVVSAVAIAVARRVPRPVAAGLWVFATVAIALGAARAVTTTYVPVLLERIADRPGLIGAVMLVNAAAGFAVPLATGPLERPARHARAVHPRRLDRRRGRARRDRARHGQLIPRPRARGRHGVRRPQRREHRAPGAGRGALQPRTGAPPPRAPRRARCSSARSPARSSAAR